MRIQKLDENSRKNLLEDTVKEARTIMDSMSRE